MTNETLRVIERRRSCRSYSDKPVSEEELKAITDAAILAPSAKNLQQRRLTVIRNAALLDEMAAAILPLLGEKNSDYHVFYHAPAVLAVSVAREAHWGREDAGIIAENVCLAAESMGLGSCILGLPQRLFERAQGRAFLDRMGVPDDYDCVLCVSIGHKKEKEIAAKPRDFGKIDYID